MGIIKYFKNLLNFKYLKKEFKKIYLKLRFFEIINIDESLSDKLQLISQNKRYNLFVNEFRNLLAEVENHNLKIMELDLKINDFINNKSIEYLLNNIDIVEKNELEEINELAITINKYKIPDNFENKNKYINYMLEVGNIFDNYQNILEQFLLVKEYDNKLSNFPDEYIDKNKSQEIIESIELILDKMKDYKKFYYNIPKLNKTIIDIHNEEFISKHIKDEIFNDVNGKSLDVEQRRAILCDSKSNLTIAGAGAGKTLTICGKVKWLLTYKNIKEEDILLLSYSKASADDLFLKVSKISSNLTVKTFHSLGLDILNNVNKEKNTVEEQFTSHIHKFFDKEIKKDIITANDIFNFYSLYLYSNSIDDKKYEDDGEKYQDLKKLDFLTLKDRLAKISDDGKPLQTIKKEIVKSYEELVLANWLFINGINYEYEKSYKIKTATIDKRQYTPDFYLPAYDIYIEHYGIDENGHTPQYNREDEINYIEGMKWKRNIHFDNNTKCLETYSYEFKNNTVFEKLKEHLLEIGVEFKPIEQNIINDALNDIYHGQDFTSLINLISTFVSLYKSQFPDNSWFEKFKNYNFVNEYEKYRTSLFLDICKSVYDYYIGQLRSQNKIDFDDMILKSIESLDKTFNYKYKYIIVDEFQDISQSRKRFLQKLISHGNSKLFAVGDDWQAIYRFAGCDVNIFLQFQDIFEDAKLNKITSTHRNSAELQSIVEPFITANPEQYKKHIQSQKHQEEPVRIIYHYSNRRSAFIKAIDNISKLDSSAEILVLGRNRRDADCLICDDIQIKNYAEIICKKYKDMKITYKTVHQSKGLESDYVILISGDDAKNGFPNQMEDDRVLQLVLGNESMFDFAEERRLFYVALTRTRSIVYILADRTNTSIFVEEIEMRAKIENPEITKRDDTERYQCPWCKSGKLIIRETDDSVFYGCSNYPFCIYLIHDLRAVRTNNRCPDCGDFLVLRNGRNGQFIGCHNYPLCTHTRNIKD